jgi:hypothetical protein
MEEKKYKTAEGKCDHCGQELQERFLTNITKGKEINHRFFCVNSGCILNSRKD